MLSLRQPFSFAGLFLFLVHFWILDTVHTVVESLPFDHLFIFQVSIDLVVINSVQINGLVAVLGKNSGQVLTLQAFSNLHDACDVLAISLEEVLCSRSVVQELADHFKRLVAC